MSQLRALTMPKWGIEMTEGTLTEWRVRPGESVSKGQIIAVVETDKIANEIECEYDAVVARILAAEGEIYPVGALLAVLGDTPAAEPQVEEFIHQFGSRPGALPAASATAPAARPTAAPPSDPKPQEQPASTIPSHIAISPAARRLALQRGVDVMQVRGSGPGARITYQDVDQASKPEVRRTPAAAVTIAPTTAHLEGVFASPYAKRLAAHHALDLTNLTGTGPRGRISRHDVIKAIGSTPAAGERAGSEGPRQQPQITRMSPTRKAIARQLTLAKSTIPHFYLRAAVRVDSLLALRARAKQESTEAATLNDYFLRAAGLALREVPDVNVQVYEDAIHRFEHADIAFAVTTEKGLVAPIIRAADTKPLAVIAAESRSLAERARDGRLRAADLEGGTFTVSNLGMFGIDQFDAIINPPQGAILAIGAARRQMVPGDHAWEQATAVNLTLSCDHRAIDGAVGARFMSALRALIESPDRL